MKKIFSRVISIFAVFALISCGLISCSDIENNESGSVSFSISPDLAKAVLDTGRSLRAETDPAGDPSANESTSPYRIEVSLSGGRAETKRHSYTESEWQAIADKSESVKGKENVTSFTFDNIPVGTQIAISATIFYARDVQHDYPCMAGKSATLEIQQGDNPVSFNVHRLAMFDIECNSDEEITGISKLNVYALDSVKASSLFEILDSADFSSKADAKLFKMLEAERPTYSYDEPRSPNLTGGFELKNGTTVNFFTLLYTENGVYLGYDSQRTSTTVSTSVPASLSFILKKLDLPDFTNLAFFPSDYADKTVSAWYASEEVSTDKTKIYALYLFGDNTFVATKRKIQDSGETREIDQQGQYTFEGNADFENGEGVALVTEGGESKEYSFSIVDGVFSIAGVDTTYELQNGDLPEPSSATTPTPSIQVIIKFLFEDESGQYAEREDFQSITAGSDYQATIPAYTARAYLLGYIMSDKTETMPTYDSEAKAYVLKIYYDLNSPAYLATGRGTPEDSSIQLAEEHQFTFTAYRDSTYDIKYSGGNDTDKVVSKGTWEDSDSDETITITESAYYDFANSSDTLTDVQGSEDQTFSLAKSSFNFKSANGIEIAFYFDGQEPESVTLDGGITVKLDSLSSEDLGEKISLSVEKAEDGKSVIITASPDESITVSKYNLILFEGQEQVSLPEGTLDSSTGSYVWTLTEDVINKLSAGNHQITVSVTIADELYTASTNLTITK